MDSQITNLDKQLLIIPLNSGQCIHLAPGEVSPPLPDYELADNAKVSKLTKVGLIKLSAPASVSSPEPPRPRKAAPSRKGK